MTHSYTLRLFSHHLDSELDLVQGACPYGQPQMGPIGILVTGNNMMRNKHREVIYEGLNVSAMADIPHPQVCFASQ